MSRKKQKKPANYIMEDVITWFTNVYVAVMLLVFPLFYQDNYYGLTTAKRMFYYRFTSVYIWVGLVLLIIYAVERRNAEPLSFKIDAVTIFAAILCVATLVGSFINENWWGSLYGENQRYFGGIVLIYGAISVLMIGNTMKWNKNILKCYLLGSGAVFLLEILNGFHLDPLRMHEGLSGWDTESFISTIGNVNFNATYNSIMLVLGIFLFLKESKWKLRVIYGAFLLLGFGSVVACRSDSCIVTMLCVLGITFFVWVKNNEDFIGYLTLIVLFLFGIFLYALFYTMFPVYIFGLGGIIGLFVTQTGMLVEGVCLCIGILAIYLLKKHNPEMNYKLFKRILLAVGMVLAGLLAVIMFPRIQLIDSFGSGRGYIWRISVILYKQYAPLQKFFGCGWYNVAGVYDQGFGEEMRNLNGTLTIDAHNEALQYLLTIGIIGVIGYFGMIVAIVMKGWKRLRNNRCLLYIVLVAASMLVQGLVNNPMVATTPLFFVNLGICYYLLNGNEDTFTQCSVEMTIKPNK